MAGAPTWYPPNNLVVLQAVLQDPIVAPPTISLQRGYRIGQRARLAVGPKAKALGEPATQLAVSLASVNRLEVVRGRKSNADTGAGIGLAVGFVAGAVFGYASSEECKSFCMLDIGREEAAVMGAAMFGLGGFVFGALIGASSQTDRWEEVPLDRLRASLGPQRDGRLGVGGSVRF